MTDQPMLHFSPGGAAALDALMSVDRLSAHLFTALAFKMDPINNVAVASFSLVKKITDLFEIGGSPANQVAVFNQALVNLLVEDLIRSESGFQDHQPLVDYVSTLNIEENDRVFAINPFIVVQEKLSHLSPDKFFHYEHKFNHPPLKEAYQKTLKKQPKRPEKHSYQLATLGPPQKIKSVNAPFTQQLQ